MKGDLGPALSALFQQVGMNLLEALLDQKVGLTPTVGEALLFRAASLGRSLAAMAKVRDAKVTEILLALALTGEPDAENAHATVNKFFARVKERAALEAEAAEIVKHWDFTGKKEPN